MYSGGDEPITKNPLSKVPLDFMVPGDTDCYGNQEFDRMTMNYEDVITEMKTMEDAYNSIDKCGVMTMDECETVGVYEDYSNKVDYVWWKYMITLLGIMKCSSKLKIIVNRIRKRNSAKK